MLKFVLIFFVITPIAHAFSGTQSNDTLVVINAIKLGKKGLAQQYLSQNLDPETINKADEYGRTALMLAANKGYADITAQLLSYPEIHINAADSMGDTALHYAVKLHNADITKLLIKHEGINLEARDILGRTPLIEAAFFNSSSNVRVLVRHADTAAKDASHNTPLMAATHFFSSTPLSVQALLEYSDVNATNINGKTALMLAAEKNSTSVAKYLLEHSNNIDINAQDKDGKTALMLAAEQAPWNTEEASHLDMRDGNTKRHKALLRQFLSIKNLEINAVDKDGRTALMLALKNRHYIAAQVLLSDSRVNANIIDKNGQTALMLVSQHSHQDSVQYLNAQHGKQMKLVHFFKKAFADREEQKVYIAKQILSRGGISSVRSLDKSGRTALGYARRSSQNKSLVRLLKTPHRFLSTTSCLGLLG